MIGADGPVAARCSRARCTADAAWAVHWRNPRVHADGRSKTWLACQAHVDELRAFVADRGFPVTVAPFAAPRDVAAETQR